MSDEIPMDHNGAPSGTQDPPASTLSVATCLSAHKVKHQWELFSSEHFVALCHKAACEACDTYFAHLITGAEGGSLSTTPDNLSKALDEAWKDGMWGIREDAHYELGHELDTACHAYDEQKAQFN